MTANKNKLGTESIGKTTTGTFTISGTNKKSYPSELTFDLEIIDICTNDNLKISILENTMEVGAIFARIPVQCGQSGVVYWRIALRDSLRVSAN